MWTPRVADQALVLDIGRRLELVGPVIGHLRQGADRYGRTLAAIRVEGHDVGDILVGEGLARTWAGRREPWC